MHEKNKLIGVCGVRIFDQNTLHFFRNMQEECERQGFRLISFSGNSDDLEETDEIIGEHQLFELLEYVDICALVILAETIKNENLIQNILEIGRKKNIPVISFNRKVEGCYNLLMDDVGGFEQIVRHVVEEHQCRRINMIAGMKDNQFSQDRIDVYRSVLEENNIPFEEDRVGYGDFWEMPTREVMKRFLEHTSDFPEAIICANDAMALTAISVLDEHGINVPEDVIVVGYDGTRNGKHFFPSLTSSIPEYKSAIKLMLEEIKKRQENGKNEPYDMTVSVGIQKRQSCGCEEKVIRNNNQLIFELLDEVGDSTWHTVAMNQLVNVTLGRQKLSEISELLPQYMHMWGEHYRYACVKAELMDSYAIPDCYTRVSSILDVNEGKFKETGETWDVKELGNYIHRALQEDNVKTVVIHLLNSGSEVYGFMIDGFAEMIDWRIQRCSEFALFLAYAIHAVINNFKMNELNQNLYKMNREIEELSLRDAMTGIYNRRGFFRKIRQLIHDEKSWGKELYLFFIDMDGLKHINDTYGHIEGDHAITTLANVLLQMGDDQMICARVGGDEFICAYAAEYEARYNEETFAAELKQYLKRVGNIAEKPYTLDASVGMVVQKISEDLKIDDLLKRADSRMYEHKSEKKHR